MYGTPLILGISLDEYGLYMYEYSICDLRVSAYKISHHKDWESFKLHGSQFSFGKNSNDASPILLPQDLHMNSYL